MKYSNLLASLTLVSAAIAGNAAQAATFQLGTLSAAPSIAFSFQAPATNFSDTFNFSLSTTSDVFASLNNVFSGINTPWYSVVILDTTGLSMSLNGGAPISNGQSTTAFGLLAGNYSAIVTGATTGTQGGIYSVSMAAQPVPVPAALWLLGSGLLGLVGIARRKA